MPNDLPLSNVAVPTINLPTEQVGQLATVLLFLLLGGMLLWKVIQSGVLDRGSGGVINQKPRGELRRGGEQRRGGGRRPRGGGRGRG